MLYQFIVILSILMTQKLTKEQYWKLFNNLSEEMKDVILSEKTATDIFDICERNKIDDISKVADYVGQTLLGVLAPDNLQKTLEKELKLKKAQSQVVIQELNRFIFYPIKTLLEELYSVKITPPSLEKPDLVDKATVPEKEESTPPRKDAYKEPIE